MIRNLKALGLALAAVFAFSAIASATASADEFTCAEGGVHKSCTLKGTSEGSEAFKSNVGAEIRCHNTYSGSDADGTATSLTIKVTKFATPNTTEGHCEAVIAGVAFKVDIEFTSCDYQFNLGETIVAGKEATGTVDVKCDTPGDHIHITVTNSGGGVKCRITVPAQTGLKHVIYKNVVNATTGKENVTVVAAATGIKYTVTEGGILGCGESNGEKVGATYTGNATVEGFNTEGKAIDSTIGA